jgi:chromosomal replication initiator protein
MIVSAGGGGDVERPQLATLWARIRGRLQAEVGEVEYRTWLRQMSLSGLDADEIAIALPTRFHRDWVRGRYGDRISALWQSELPAVRRVEFHVGNGTEIAPLVVSEMTVTYDPAAASAETGEARGDGRTEATPGLDQRLTFDTFVVGKPNEFAHACARRVADSPATPGFNPLFLYGGVGLGKTHLMHAIAWDLTKGSEQHGRRPATIIYMSAERFMYRFIHALRSHAAMEFKEELRSSDVLMIDDLQFLIGKDNTQEEFFHTFNHLVDAGKQIVVSADKSPSDLNGLEDRLRTRLGCGMVADLHATTFELRMSILDAKAQRANVSIPTKVMEFLASRITSNVRELEGALNRLLAHASLFSRPISLDSTQEVLHDILKAHERRVTIEEIQRRVAEHYGIRLTDMSSARRSRSVARPRQVAMYLAKHLTSRSLPEIGRKFGNRDHTTVMHAVSRVSELMERDGAFADDIELLRRLLET